MARIEVGKTCFLSDVIHKQSQLVGSIITTTSPNNDLPCLGKKKVKNSQKQTNKKNLGSHNALGLLGSSCGYAGTKTQAGLLGVMALPFILKWGVMGGRGAERRSLLHTESSLLENG